MNFHRITQLAFLTLLTTGCVKQSCQYSCPEDVLCQTYVHKYGVEIPPDDWSHRGQSGQVVSTLKDGTTVVKTYDEGALHGDCTYSFPHSSVIAKREKYQQGNLSCETFYYRSGFGECEVVPLDNGRRKVTSWFESGEPKCIEELEGERIFSGVYYTPDNVVEARIDEGEGEKIERDPYGQLISKTRIAHGYPIEITFYHPNGNPKEIVPLKNHLKQGTTQTFLPDGEPASKEEWVGGVQQGIKTLYENGEVLARIPYVNGVVQGIEERYKDGSTLATRITWVAGVRHGPTYHYTGDRVTTDWYYYDRPVSQNDFELLSTYTQKSRIMD